MLKKGMNYNKKTERRGGCVNTGYHKTVHPFRNFLWSSPSSALYKVETWKKILETCVQRCLWDEGRGRVCSQLFFLFCHVIRPEDFRLDFRILVVSWRFNNAHALLSFSVFSPPVYNSSWIHIFDAFYVNRLTYEFKETTP